MGMFDYVELGEGVSLPPESPPMRRTRRGVVEFQSKDFDCTLATVTLYPDRIVTDSFAVKELVEDASMPLGIRAVTKSEVNVCADHHGDVYFYTVHEDGWTLVEFKARYAFGKLHGIELVQPAPAPASPEGGEA